MKYLINKLIPITVLLVLFVSCEKEIKLTLDGTEPRVVIEALLTNKSGPGACQVLISTTTDYFTEAQFNGVKNAEVIISDDQGNSETLTEIEDGIYSSNTIVGEPGRIYYMKVTIQEKIYTAESIMKPHIEIESLTTVYNDILTGPFEEEGYLLTCNYSNAEANSFVALFVKKNDKRGDEIYLANGLFGFQIEDVFQIGDEATVELRNLNEVIYHYYANVNKLSGADGNPLNSGGIPANPISNISNGALGYFAVYPSSTKSIIVTE